MDSQFTSMQEVDNQSGHTLRPTRAYITYDNKSRFHDAINDIQEAVRKGLPGDREPYKKAVVFMFHWDNVDFDVMTTETDLANVFEHQFNFEVIRYTIPHAAQVPRSPLRKELCRLVDTIADEDTMMIYVYSGHAYVGPQLDCYLYGSHSDRDAVGINWNVMRLITDEAPGPKLFILDCCYATTSAIDSKYGDLLAASSMEMTTTVGPRHCFTKRLTELLMRKKGQVLTVANYYSMLVSNLGAPGSRLLATPVYVPPSIGESVLLVPIPKTRPKIPNICRTHNDSQSKVLVAIHLEEGLETIQPEDFKRYLLSKVPTSVADIDVMGVFKTNSRLYLCIMPTSVWAMLPERASFHFIAHVMSSNLLSQRTSMMSLVDRSNKYENVPPSSRSGSDKP